MINPDNPIHKNLEKEVKDYLEQNDFVTYEATYHSLLEEKYARLFSRIETPTSLYLRTRADRVAFRVAYSPTVFEWEAKTHTSQKYHDMTLEALPMCHHLSKAELDVRCLYVYRNPYKNHECGFWVHNMPPIRIIMIPSRWTDVWKKWFRNKFEPRFPDIKIVDTLGNGGSGDPFLIIDECEVEKLPHWSSLINDIPIRDSHDNYQRGVSAQ